MKTSTAALSFLVACFVMSPSKSLGGAEGHGGDATALEFVKIGQALKVLLQSHPSWKVSQLVSSQELSWSINNSFVSTGISTVTGVPTPLGSAPKVIFTPDQVDTYDRNGNIFIHRTQWQMLNCDQKIREVFHLYLTLLNYDLYYKKKIDDSTYQISSQLPSDLATRNQCSLIFNDREIPVADHFSNLSISEQVKILRHDIFEYIDGHPRWPGHKALQRAALTDFKFNLLDDRHTEIFTTHTPVDKWPGRTLPAWLKDKDIETFADSFGYDAERDDPYSYLLPEQDFMTRDREIHLAATYLSNDTIYAPIRIWINEKTWPTLTYDQKFELIFHEYFSLFSTMDLYFRISSTLFLER